MPFQNISMWRVPSSVSTLLRSPTHSPWPSVSILPNPTLACAVRALPPMCTCVGPTDDASKLCSHFQQATAPWLLTGCRVHNLGGRLREGSRVGPEGEFRAVWAGNSGGLTSWSNIPFSPGKGTMGKARVRPSKAWIAEQRPFLSMSEGDKNGMVATDLFHLSPCCYHMCMSRRG